MFIDQAKEIIDSLSKGIDPITGDKLPIESPYNDKKVISALTTACNYIKDTKKHVKWFGKIHRSNIDNGKPKSSGLPWTSTLIKELEVKHNEGKTIDELSEHFERSHGAIEQRLVKLGLIKQTKKWK